MHFETIHTNILKSVLFALSQWFDSQPGPGDNGVCWQDCGHAAPCVGDPTAFHACQGWS